MTRYLLAVALALAFLFGGDVFMHIARKQPVATAVRMLPASAQVICPGPDIRILDPVTGKDVTSIGFGNVLVGQQKIVQVTILNPPGSPCNLTLTTARNGEIHIEG